MIGGSTVAAGLGGRARPAGGFLYGWLLVALFVEYARPASQLTFLNFPFFYSLVPLSLLLVSSFAPGLRPMKDVMADPLAKWIYVLAALVGISVLVAPRTDVALAPFTMVLGYTFLFTVMVRLVTTEERLRGVVVTLLIGHLYLLAMNPIVLTNPETRNYILGATFLGDGNDFALSLCILIPCLVEASLSARKALWRGLGWISVALLIAAIIASQSRGGTLGLAAVLVYLWWRSPRKGLAGVGVAVVGILVLLYAPSQYFDRLGTLTSGALDGSAQARLEAWMGAIGMGLKNPVFGIGARHFGTRWGMTAHSSYMLAFAELGIPGLVTVLMLVFGNLRANALLRGRLLTRAGPAPGEDVRRTMRLLDLLNAGMVGFAVAGAFLSATYYPHLFVLTALLISARILVARQAGLTGAITSLRRPGYSRTPARPSRDTGTRNG